MAREKIKGHLIKNVKENSIASELEIEPGDSLLKINGEVMDDIFDYQYLIEDDYIEVLIRKENGEEWLLEIEKDYSEDIGIEFEQGLMDEYKSCYNKCIFCFIDQMPKGMRETLYFKDDDSRLSFLQGNYITLTNMSDKDVDRIIRFHLCPINISVHTTNPELRCKMLHNRFAGDALKNIKKLADNCIEMNGQIVLCKNVNDGDELVRSIEDLSEFLPHMRSVSVVPSGLTKYREGLYPLIPFEKEDAVKVIDTIEKYQKDFYEKYGLHFIHASDEWYIMAERDFPEEERYDGYIQLENGVGMMRLLYDEFNEALNDSGISDITRNVTIATGYSAYGMIKQLSELYMEKYKNTKINVVRIDNNFFGTTITVSGLLTATDLYEQLKDMELGDKLLLPGNVLRSGEDVFLDDVTLSELSDKLGIDIVIPSSEGSSLFEAISFENFKNEEYNKSNFVYVKYYKNR